MFDFVFDPRFDDRIRAALREADTKGNLGAIATETGIAGGCNQLKKIMESTYELSIMDRGLLGMHLRLA